jgi:hypothetical protein
MNRSPNCGGKLKIIAAIPERTVIERIPTYPELRARALRLPPEGQTGQQDGVRITHARSAALQFESSCRTPADRPGHRQAVRRDLRREDGAGKRHERGRRGLAGREPMDTQRPAPTRTVANAPLSDITRGSARFVAVGGAGWGGGAPAFVSTDGVNWQVDSTITDLPAMNAVTTGANEYLAGGDTHRERSSDGLLWSATPMTDCGNGILWDGTRYVAVGAAICRSQ